MTIQQTLASPLSFKPHIDEDNFAQKLAQFFRQVDQRCAQIDALLHAEGLRLNCQKGCYGCCQAGLSCSPAEAYLILKTTAVIDNASLNQLKYCPFLNAEGACCIYEQRPLICRSHGYPLRWIDEKNEAEYRDICELNEPCLQLEKLEKALCWSIGLAELQLQMLNQWAFHNKEKFKLLALYKLLKQRQNPS